MQRGIRSLSHLDDAAIEEFGREVDAIRDESPPYRRFRTARLVEDVGEQTEQHARLMPRVLRAGRVPNRDELASARKAAQRRVHDGIPLDAVTLEAERVVASPHVTHLRFRVID